MAATVHSVQQIAIGAASGSVRSGGITVPTLTGGAVAVVPIWADGSARTITSVAIDAASLSALSGTFISSAGSDGSTPGEQGWGLVTPTAGAATLSIGTSSATLLTGAYAIYFEGVDPGAPFGGGVTAFNTTPNATPSIAVTASANQLPIAICGAYDGFSNLAGGQTTLGTKITDGIFSAVSWVLQTAASPNPTFTWSLTASGAGGNIQSGFVVNGVSAGGSIVRQMMQHHG